MRQRTGRSKLKLFCMVGAVCAVALPSASAIGTDSDKVTALEAAGAMAVAFPDAVDQPAGGEPELEASATGFTSNGSPSDVTISSDAEAAVKVETDAGQLSLIPLDVNGAASEGAVVNDGAVVFANTGIESDTAVRPVEDGVETFTGIRSSEAAEEYSWRIDLPGDEVLAETGTGEVVVLDPTPAHDIDKSRAEARDATTEELAAAKADGLVAADAVAPDPNAAAEVTDSLQAAGPSAFSGDISTQQPVAAETAAAPDGGGEAAPEAVGGEESALAATSADAKRAASAELAETTAMSDAANAMADAARTDEVAEPVVTAVIQKTWATDADGDSVPTSLEVQGDTITMRVEHLDEDTAYPVVADPYVEVLRTRTVWRCCRPVQRQETYVAGWDEQWLPHGTWPWYRILEYPGRYSNYSGDYWVLYSPWGTTYVTYQPRGAWWVQAWVYNRVPRYASRTVVSYEGWWDVQESIELEWDEPTDFSLDKDTTYIGPYEDDAGDDQPTAHASGLWAPIVVGCLKWCPKIGKGFKKKPGKAKIRIPAHPKYADDFVAAAGKNTSVAATALGKALAGTAKKAAEFRALGFRAHHIVASHSPKARFAQAILQRYGIHPNSAANGVWLRAKFHQGLHTDWYYANVNSMLRRCALGNCLKSEVEDILREIGERLVKNDFWY